MNNIASGQITMLSLSILSALLVIGDSTFFATGN